MQDLHSHDFAAPVVQMRYQKPRHFREDSKKPAATDKSEESHRAHNHHTPFRWRDPASGRRALPASLTG